MSARAPPAPSRPDCERSRWRPARPRHRNLAAAWSCGCCLGLGVGTAGSGIFGEVDFSDLHIPLLRMTRIEVLVKFLSIDLLLGHCLVDRAERLVLGVLEALPHPSWLEARSEVAIKALQRGCTICKLGG